MIPRLDLDPPPSRQYVTTDQAAQACRVRADLVRQWAKRGHIKPAGRAYGRPIYLLSDVLRHWSATRRDSAA